MRAGEDGVQRSSNQRYSLGDEQDVAMRETVHDCPRIESEEQHRGIAEGTKNGQRERRIV